LEHKGNRAVREGEWKLVAREDEPWELYDLRGDRSELADPASKHREKVREIAAKWEAWAVWSL
jgi:arylsulfatase